LWQVLKDSVGKDIWRITVPVYFNEPLGALQKCAGVTEYLDLLDKAVDEPDEGRRLALIAIHFATQYNNVERMGMNKPFNPLLGETFEISKPGQYRLISEQVSHHPPVSAFFIEGEKGYHKYATFHTKTSFGMGTMGFTNVFNEYLDVLP
jgi:oxysterol-binding protein 1